MKADLLVANGRVVIPPLGEFRLNLAVQGGKISALLDQDETVEAEEAIDASGHIVIPGGIDVHTHIGYAGKRGMPLDALSAQFESESRAALVGGVTTLINTYRNEAAYTSIFSEMRRAGEENSHVDFAYSLGILNETHVEEIPRYYHDYGITSFKLYMAYRGSDSAASGNAANRYTDDLLLNAMRQTAGVPGGMVMVHAENYDLVDQGARRLRMSEGDPLKAWNASRPDYAEAESIRRAAFLSDVVGCPLYVPHVSSARGLEQCREHRKKSGVPLYVEVCAHHLALTEESDLGLLGKVNPPLRTSRDSDTLWNALRDGTVDTAGSDHAAINVEQKGPTIWEGTPGLPGIGTLLPVLLTGASDGRCSVLDVARLTSYQPAKVFGLYPRKGSLLVGSDADLVIVDMNARRPPNLAQLGSAADYTPYAHLNLTGWPIATVRAGKVVVKDGSAVVGGPMGHYLARWADTRG